MDAALHQHQSVGVAGEPEPVGGEDGAESRHTEVFLAVEVQGEVGSFCVAAQGAAEGLLA